MAVGVIGHGSPDPGSCLIGGGDNVAVDVGIGINITCSSLGDHCPSNEANCTFGDGVRCVSDGVRCVKGEVR